MGTLFSTLDIGRSGLQTAQVQLDVAGHNIANVNKRGFSRQRVELVSRIPIRTPFGQIGRGVAISGIERVRDTFLDGLFRRQSAGLGDAELRAQFFNRIEDVFLEPGENGLSGRLNVFFDALNAFANNVEELPVRQSVLNEAQALSGLLNTTADRLRVLRTNANEEIINFVPEINSLADRIALLNRNIRQLEVTGHPANDLRDDRDVLLDDLSRITNIFTRERSDGTVDVLISGEVLVNGDRTRALEAVRVPGLDPERNDLVEVRFVDNGAVLIVEDGELFGALTLRDDVLVRIDNDLDALAGGIIHAINRIHSQGNGLAHLSGTIQSTYAVSDPSIPLDTAGLPFGFDSGSFTFERFDSNGVSLGSVTVAVTPGVTSLNDIAAALGANGSVTPDGRLEISVGPGERFALSNDTSGMLAALGVNGLFTGFDARTIGVHQAILDNPLLLASGYDTDPLNTGDNRAALDLAAVRNAAILENGSATINDFYEGIIVRLGVDSQTNRQNLAVQQAFANDFEIRRQEVSGVSLDEEVTFLIQFQRAFEASARVITVTDRMLETLLNIAL